MARLQGPAAYPVLGRAFGTVGAVLLSAAAMLASVRSYTLSGYSRGEGTVVELRLVGRSYHPVVELTPPGSGAVRFEGGVGSNPPRHRVGDRVGVRYSPADPREALVDDLWSLWFFPLLLGGISLPFAVLGVVFTLRSRRRRRSPDEVSCAP